MLKWKPCLVGYCLNLLGVLFPPKKHAENAIFRIVALKGRYIKIDD